jgi:hypothetical protein
VEFSTGAVASVTASRIAKERVRRLRIYQADGYLSLDLGTGRGEFLGLREGWVPGEAALDQVTNRILLEAGAADALGLELSSFIHAVQGDSAAVVSGAEGRAALGLALRVSEAVRLASLSPHADA